MTTYSLIKGACIAGVVGLSACTSYTPEGSVFPLENEQFKLIATSRTEHGALKVAQIDAEGVCKSETKSKKYAVIKQSSSYVGPDKSADTGKGFGGAALKAVTAYSNLHNSENYKVEMVFKCKG